ncbi:MAG TPA: glycosyltransferase family 87 protein [Chthoniobacteraceae bacterium]|nr:glycosyltransferase family 87 protein [Chthoniobacteraceae bacterium]
MDSRETQNKTAGLREILQAVAICTAVIAVAVLWISTMIKPRGDFLLHYEFGRRLRTGEFLYTGGMHLPYPPAWGMLFLPFSLLPLRVAMPLFFVFGIAALAALLKILRDLTANFPRAKETAFWVAAVTMCVLSRFVLRDLADGGENLVIVALSWAGIYFFVKQKPLPGGALLGLAIALKCTPLLFAGYLVLKRQWLAAISTLIFSALFFVSPIVVQGPSAYFNHIRFWKGNIVAGVSQKDPSVGVLGPDELANKSLRPMLARYLMRLPDGHPGRIASPAYVDFLKLPPATAGLIIKLVTLCTGLAVFWLFVRSPGEMTGRNFLWECAIINALMLLFSPITWGEHCVSLIPAVYLICLRFIDGRPVPRWIKAVLGITVFLLIVINRSTIGYALSELGESYHVVTFCIIALTVVSFAFWNERVSALPAA